MIHCVPDIFPSRWGVDGMACTYQRIREEHAKDPSFGRVYRGKFLFFFLPVIDLFALKSVISE